MVIQLTAVLAAEGRHDDTRLDPGSVRDPLEEPVRIARGLGPLVLVVERTLDPVPAKVRRLRDRAGLRRIEAVAGDARLLRVADRQLLSRRGTGDGLRLRRVRLERQGAPPRPPAVVAPPGPRPPRRGGGPSDGRARLLRLPLPLRAPP